MSTTDGTTIDYDAELKPPFDEPVIKIIKELKVENEKLKAQIPQWISVNDRVPDDNNTVLIYSKLGIDMSRSYKDRFNHDRTFNAHPEYFVTHWMRLPPVPEDE